MTDFFTKNYFQHWHHEISALGSGYRSLLFFDFYILIKNKKSQKYVIGSQKLVKKRGKTDLMKGNIFLFLFFFLIIFNTSCQGSRKSQNMNSSETVIYLDLAQLKLIDAVPRENKSLYISGEFTNGSFQPTSEVIGDIGEGIHNGTPGWVELADQQFYPMQTGRAPSKPYIEGVMEKGNFVPSSKVIVR